MAIDAGGIPHLFVHASKIFELDSCEVLKGALEYQGFCR